jgi:hypothetical protein
MDCQTTALPVLAPLGLPGEVRSAGKKLLNQQCWCWGRDIRYKPGNLLLRYGFSRFRVPEGRQGSSAYTLELGERSIVVWGWGVWYGHGGEESLYLPRHTMRPELMAPGGPPSTVWSLEAMPTSRLPRRAEDWRRVRGLLQGCCATLAEYERWIMTTAGLAYRCDCVARWHRTSIPAESMAPQWHQLSWLCGAN